QAVAAQFELGVEAARAVGRVEPDAHTAPPAGPVLLVDTVLPPGDIEAGGVWACDRRRRRLGAGVVGVLDVQSLLLAAVEPRLGAEVHRVRAGGQRAGDPRARQRNVERARVVGQLQGCGLRAGAGRIEGYLDAAGARRRQECPGAAVRVQLEVRGVGADNGVAAHDDVAGA